MYSNETQNYKLPQYLATDTMDPVADWNPAFQKIDTELYKANQGVENISEMVQRAEQAVTEARAEASLAQTAAARAENILSGKLADIDKAIQAYDGLVMRLNAMDLVLSQLDNRITALEQK